MHHGLGGNDGGATRAESTGGLAETVGDAVSVINDRYEWVCDSYISP